MGKKGKKKAAKITGTPEVQEFKKTPYYWLFKECVTIQESLPFVAIDTLDEIAYKKVARFLNMVGLLAEFLGIHSKKEYRFNNHHKYLAPTPQFFPCGFDVDVIRQARTILDHPDVTYNGRRYTISEKLRADSETFLKSVDEYMTKIATATEPRLKDDFANGLKHFKLDLKEIINVFDILWMAFEEDLLKARHEILAQVYEPIDRLVTLELLLTQAEERLDIPMKQRLENEFIYAVHDFAQEMQPDLIDPFPDDVIPLAEACIFYESKCTEEWLHLAKHLIKDYLELRIFIAKIPEDRLNPQLKENTQLMKLLRTFFTSVVAAREALDFVSRLPKLIHAKTSDWMTKKLLEPDLRYIQKTAGIGESFHGEGPFLPESRLATSNLGDRENRGAQQTARNPVR